MVRETNGCDQAQGRAGHSVDVLLKIYAGCIDAEADTANQRIDQALQS
jgi:hypothetical protein